MRWHPGGFGCGVVELMQHPRPVSRFSNLMRRYSRYVHVVSEEAGGCGNFGDVAAHWAAFRRGLRRLLLCSFAVAQRQFEGV